MPRSCLKFSTPPMTPGGVRDCLRKKAVAFCAGELEKVYTADEWDRTPTEAAPKLSYGDVLELKAIQRSLYTAAQPVDPLARRATAQYLTKVPIGLLPLYDNDQPANSVVPAPVAVSLPSELPPVPTRSPNFSLLTSTIYSPTVSPRPSPPGGSPVLGPVQSTPTPPTTPMSTRPKLNIAWMPLLDNPATHPPACEPRPFPPAPPSSEADTDESDPLSTPALSNASLDTTPSPVEEAPVSTHSYFNLPLRKPKYPSDDSYFPHTRAVAPSSRPAYGHPALPTPSPFSLYPPGTILKPKAPKPKTPSYDDSHSMYINGELVHFGPPFTPPPDSPALCEVPLSPLKSLEPHPPTSPNDTPFFAFGQEEGQDLPPSLSRTPHRDSSPLSTPSRAKELSPPSPLLAPFCVSMKRRIPTPVNSRST